jgi:hypothetical protein
MKTFSQKTRTAILLFGSVALIALMTATPVVPAQAQGVPAGLLRLDPPRQANDGQITELNESHAKVRAAYARVRKPQLRQQ